MKTRCNILFWWDKAVKLPALVNLGMEYTLKRFHKKRFQIAVRISSQAATSLEFLYSGMAKLPNYGNNYEKRAATVHIIALSKSAVF